jgi:hypothetical protein
MMTVKLLAVLAMVIPGQSKPAAVAQPPSAVADEGGGLLADAYVDGTCGFSIRPPKGWQLIRQRLAEEKGLTLLQMVGRVGPNQTEQIALKQTSTTRKMPMGDMLKQLHHELALVRNKLEVLSLQEQEIGGRPGGLLTASYEEAGLQWFMQEAVIEQRPQQYYVLLYTGPLAERRTSEPLFQMVLSSLRLLADQLSDTELAEALAAGAEQLAGLDKDRLHAAISDDLLLRLEIDGKVAGFVRVQQAAGEVKRRPGVQVQERGWMFPPEGGARRLQSNMFIADGLREEEWTTSVSTCFPAKGDLPAYLDASLEEGVRNGEILIASQEYRLGEGVTEKPAIKTPKGYVSRALLRMWPGWLGDLAKPRRLAFTEYDHERAGFVVRLFDVKGVADAPSGVAAKGKLYKVEQREGVAGQMSEWYVDEKGRIVCVKAGNVTMIPAEEKEMEKLFAGRIAEAEREMARLEQEYERAEQRFGPKRKPPTTQPARP